MSYDNQQLNNNCRPTKITREMLDELPDLARLGQYEHIGRTVKILEILGGFASKENASLADKIYEPDANEAAQIENRDSISETVRYRTWRMNRFQKICSGTASISTLEAARLHSALGKTLGGGVADLFTSNEMATLPPGRIVERIVTSGGAAQHLQKNPILLLRILAELSPDPMPTIQFSDPDRLRMTDQGDGRINELKSVGLPPVLKVGASFFLEIDVLDGASKQIIVFEYALGDIINSSNLQPVLAVPMPYLQRYGDKVRVVNAQNNALVAGEVLGQFGFCVITAPSEPSEDEPLSSQLGINADLQEWSTIDVLHISQKLGQLCSKSSSKVTITMFDYEKHST